ncbi:MAG: ThuA domain-containing protein [Acidobacteria bacterium]|jgi:hypothetical protein|nr:ThuA domain-containing protein [Bryobacteraceae bacterium CoA2 C42]
MILGLIVIASLVLAQGPGKKRILVVGQSKGWQHDSTSEGMATIWKLGKETGLWDTYIRTDTQLVTKKKLGANGKNLDYFDAVFFYLNYAHRAIRPA